MKTYEIPNPKTVEEYIKKGAYVFPCAECGGRVVDKLLRCESCGLGVSGEVLGMSTDIYKAEKEHDERERKRERETMQALSKRKAINYILNRVLLSQSLMTSGRQFASAEVLVLTWPAEVTALEQFHPQGKEIMEEAKKLIAQRIKAFTTEYGIELD